MRRILLVLALLLPGLALAAPARAGGWAATYLDPVPASFQAGATYTVGFWMLQHGTHPYEGSDLGKVGLKFTDGARSLEFTGVELKEKAHYAAALALPAGRWKVEAIQGWFAPFEIGTLQVPGALAVKPLDPELNAMLPRYLEMNGGKDPWGQVRPPGLSKAAVAPAAGTVAPAARAPSTAPALAASASLLPYGVALGLLAVAGAAWLVVRRRVRA
ncbi:hypothetical protein [Nonomuraea dietziae]|uniref:hypothetical protein n=1 Tax=Nonomuraea dietziae TaxID=65515 RepID=UPI0033FC3373